MRSLSLLLVAVVACGDKDPGTVAPSDSGGGSDDAGTASDSGTTDGGGEDSGGPHDTGAGLHPCDRLEPWDPGLAAPPDVLAPAVGDHDLSTEAQLEAFCSAHDAVLGTLTVRVGAVEDLDALACLVSVQGTLHVEAPALIRLSLPALQQVDGDLVIDGAEGLEALELGALTHVGGTVALSGLDALADVDGAFPFLARVGGALDLSGLDGLERVPSFPELTYVGAELVLDGPPTAETLSLPSLRTVVGPLHLSGMPTLTTLDLASLEWTGGLEMDDLALASLPLPALQMIDGSLRLAGLDELSDLAGMSELQCWRALELSGLARLADVSTLDGSTTRPTGIRVEQCRELGTVDALSSVEEVTGPVTLASLPRLTSVEGLSRLRAVEGALTLSTCRALTDVGGLVALDTVGGLELHELDTIVDLSGLEALREVDGDLTISQNDSLVDVMGLSSLDRVEGDLTIEDNDVLSSSATDLLLDALGDTVVDGTTTVEGNAE